MSYRPKIDDWKPEPNVSYPNKAVPVEWEDMRADLEQLKQTLTDKINDRAKAATPPDRLYHYTDGFALHSIVEKREVWLSDYRYTNDALEGELPMRMLVDYFDSKWTVRQSVDFSRWQSEVDKHYQAMPHWQPTFFLACFSENSDSLLQWLGYGSGGSGYEIEVEASSLADIQPPEVLFDYVQRHVEFDIVPKVLSPRLIKVEYDEAAQKAFVDELAEVLYRTNEKWETAFKANSAVFERYKPHFFALCDNICRLLGPHFKDKAFATEQEWRCVISVEKATKSFCHPFVRRAADQFVPFITLPVTLSGLRAGPKADYENLRTAYSGRAVASQYGFGQMLKIAASKQPLK